MKWVILIVMLPFCCTGFAATEEFSSTAIWPKDRVLGDNQKITIYQPQVDSLQKDQLLATSAFKIDQNNKEFFGSFKLSAKALVNKEDDVVSISNMKISDVQMPVGKFDAKKLQTQIQDVFSGKEYQVTYQSVRANLDVLVSEADRPTPEIKNNVPNFIYTTKPGVLVMIAGDPVWGNTKGNADIKRVMNTSVLILHQNNQNYYLWAAERWYSSDDVLGPYKPSKDPSSQFVTIKDDLIKENKIDPMSGTNTSGESIYPAGVNPDIYVSTKPAELLQSEGDPQYSPVSETSLLYMSNSPNSIFLDSKTQEYYVLVTGRWFVSKNLRSGPWTYVSGKNLPADFAKIPSTSPVSEVLVSVPGTPQAKEAKIVSDIPQMAKVPRNLKPQNIQCDGTAKWVTIPDSSLLYAENCNTPIIQITDKQYYAVQDGVWFVAVSPRGPWTVATVVPNVIYRIPSSSPIYYVTYVRVYGSDAGYVTVGYTPGYHGTFVSADGTIVYGTGYVYPYYVTPTVWYPPPVTYGFGVGYGWGYGDGFFMGFAVGAILAPWGWGYCCWRGPYNVHVVNIYHHWGPRTIITGPRGGVIVNRIGNRQFIRSHNAEVFAGRNGQIFRRNQGGQWQQYRGPGSWNNVNRNTVSHLEDLHQRRTSEFSRMQPSFPTTATRSPSRTSIPTGRQVFQRQQQPQFLRGGMRSEHFRGEGFRR